ncbi:EMC3/TMCO1 family protein [Candidatus Nanohalobium constans]|uniref:Putative membrane protein n=1 Tax=Candidatus Nanohalobium constans TaxID=2565781 RepID=A0A5Q0UIL0_9ARCH|nr:EMC3/TMCO1 family protein [Candidatus Nanohalobium constans]QGA80960.1 putative membrane protein [Candidatus Nanohalobium constans]
MIAGLLTALYSFYNVVFQPVLSLGPYIALGFFSACLAILFSGIRYWLLDHEKAEKIQDKISEKQEKMKEARENDNHEKASKHTKDVFKHNQEFMLLNMKPMIGTMLFVALIFPWLGATFAPTAQITQTTGQMYEGNFTYAQTQTPITVDNTTETPVLQVDNQSIEPGEAAKINGFKWTYKGIKEKTPGFFSNTEGTVANFNGKFIQLPFTLPWIGGALNWLGFYIIITMPMTLILNKTLGIQ